MSTQFTHNPFTTHSQPIHNSLATYSHSLTTHSQLTHNPFTTHSQPFHNSLTTHSQDGQGDTGAGRDGCAGREGCTSSGKCQTTCNSWKFRQMSDDLQFLQVQASVRRLAALASSGKCQTTCSSCKFRQMSDDLQLLQPGSCMKYVLPALHGHQC